MSSKKQISVTSGTNRPGVRGGKMAQKVCSGDVEDDRKHQVVLPQQSECYDAAERELLDFPCETFCGNTDDDDEEYWSEEQEDGGDTLSTYLVSKKPHLSKRSRIRQKQKLRHDEEQKQEVENKRKKQLDVAAAHLFSTAKAYEAFPEEVWAQVLEYLEFHSVWSFSRTCKWLKLVATNGLEGSKIQLFIACTCNITETATPSLLRPNATSIETYIHQLRFAPRKNTTTVTTVVSNGSGGAKTGVSALADGDEWFLPTRVPQKDTRRDKSSLKYKYFDVASLACIRVSGGTRDPQNQKSMLQEQYGACFTPVNIVNGDILSSLSLAVAIKLRDLWVSKERERCSTRTEDDRRRSMVSASHPPPSFSSVSSSCPIQQDIITRYIEHYDQIASQASKDIWSTMWGRISHEKCLKEDVAN